MSSNPVFKNLEWTSSASVLIQVPQTQIHEEPAIDVDSTDPAAVQNEIERMIQKARTEADQMLTQARLQSELILERAKKDGYQEGYRTGEQQARLDTQETCEGLIHSAERVVFAANAERENILSGISSILSEVVMEAVRTLVRGELQAKTPDIKPVVEELLKYVMQGTRIEIRVHPDNLDQVVHAKPRMQSEKFGDLDVMVIPDPAMTPGGCKIRSDSGYVDASMETKMAKLKQVVERHIGRIVDECV